MAKYPEKGKNIVPAQLRASWWLAILLAIPLSIIANLVTPHIQEWLNYRTEAQAIERVAILNEEYLLTEKFSNDEVLLTNYLISVVIKAALYLSFTLMINYILGFIINYLDRITIASTIHSHERWRYWNIIVFLGRGLHTLIAIIGMLLILNLCLDGLEMYTNVEQFELFKERNRLEVDSLTPR